MNNDLAAVITSKPRVALTRTIPTRSHTIAPSWARNIEIAELLQIIRALNRTLSVVDIIENLPVLSALKLLVVHEHSDLHSATGVFNALWGVAPGVQFFLLDLKAFEFTWQVSLKAGAIRVSSSADAVEDVCVFTLFVHATALSPEWVEGTTEREEIGLALSDALHIEGTPEVLVIAVNSWFLRANSVHKIAPISFSKWERLRFIVIR